MKTPTALTRRVAGAVTTAALAAGSVVAAGALSPAAAVTPISTGSITGTIVGPDGVGIPNAEARLYYYDTDDGAWQALAYAYGGLAGDYTFAHLPAGAYRLRFEAGGYVAEFYNDAATVAAATSVSVTTTNTAVPTATLAVSPSTVTPDATTDVTGVVTDAVTGKPLYGIYIYAYDATTGNSIDWAYTDSVGRYTLNHLDGHSAVKLSYYDYDYGGADLGHREIWAGGATSQSAAAPVVLTPGAAVTVSQALTPYAGISGRVLNPSGVAAYEGGSIRAYDADTTSWSGADVRPDGTFYLGGLNPGEQYRLQFSDGYDYPGNDSDADPTYYYDVWSGGGSNFSTATPVVAGAVPASWTGNVNATLSSSLVALEKPSIGGTVVIGKKLTAKQGRWNRNGNSTFTYEWLRGGVVAGTASTYVLTAADAGKAIALRVTNTNHDYGRGRSVSATTAATVAKYASAVSARGTKIKKGKSKGAVEVTVSVKAGSQATTRTTGTVTVTEGKKKVATLTVKNGKAVFVAKTPGRHSYTLAYSGNGTTLGDRGNVSVTVAKKSKKK